MLSIHTVLLQMGEKYSSAHMVEAKISQLSPDTGNLGNLKLKADQVLYSAAHFAGLDVRQILLYPDSLSRKMVPLHTKLSEESLGQSYSVKPILPIIS